MKQIIRTTEAPKPIGTYSQAIKAGNILYLAGQIPLDPSTLKLIDGNLQQQVHQVFTNLARVAEAAGGSLDRIVKLTVYLMDLNDTATVNTVMEQLFTPPYPARAAIGVAALPMQAKIEIDAIMVLSG